MKVFVTIVVVIKEGVISENFASVGQNEKEVSDSAEKKYIEKVKEFFPTASDEEINDSIDDGYFDSETTNMSVCLSHSITNNEESFEFTV